MTEHLPRVERSDDGHPVFIHNCNGTVTRETLPLGPNGWQWAEDGALAPSINCQTCRTHGFWAGPTEPEWRGVDGPQTEAAGDA